MKTYCAIDTETTGLERGSRIVQIAAFAFLETGEMVKAYSTNVDPEMPIPRDATAIHGLTDADVRNAPKIAPALDHVFASIPDGAELVIHNASFDCGIIAWEAARARLPVAPYRVIDTLGMARALKLTKKNDLEYLVKNHEIQRFGQAHTAVSDAHACGMYFMFARKHMEPAVIPFRDTGYDFGYTDDFPLPLANLPDLVRAGGSMTFRYEDSNGAATERTLTPYGWYTLGETLYFTGLCHLRKERRTFRADRVQAVLATAEAA